MGNTIMLCFKRIGLYIIFLSLVLINSCKTNPPNSPPTIIVEYGKIFVAANIDSAFIFLDNLNTGKVTPDTITAAVGSHTIRLEKPNYISSSMTIEVVKDSVKAVSLNLQVLTAPKIVLMEDFPNVSCNPCALTNIIVESLLNYTYGRTRVAAVKYHIYWPKPNDPFYLVSKPYSDDKLNYYNIQTGPTIILDGLTRPVPSDSNAIKAAIDSILTEQPKFVIDVEESINGLDYSVNVNVEVLDTSGLDFQNLVLHTVITETDIEFATPPGGNGETKFFDICRRMMPDQNGEQVQNITSKTYVRQTQLLPDWNTNKLHTVAFIQNKLTKKVYQAGTSYN